MGKEEFEDILQSAKHIHTIQFDQCYIEIDSMCNFEDNLDGSTFKKLDFDDSGQSSKSNWNKDGREFKNIIEGLSKVESVKQNLEEIGLSQCNITKDLALKIIKNGGFDDVKVTGLNQRTKSSINKKRKKNILTNKNRPSRMEKEEKNPYYIEESLAKE